MLLGARDAERESRRGFLAAMGLPFLLIPAALSLRGHTEANWTGAAYCSLAPLAAVYIREMGRGRRIIIVSGAVFSLGAFVLLHWGQVTYPIVARAQRASGIQMKAADLDPSHRARDWDLFGAEIARQLEQLPRGTVVLTPTYQLTALARFYGPGHSATYRFAAYLRGGAGWSQYEIWPERRLDRPELIGRDVLLVLTRPNRGFDWYFESLVPLGEISAVRAGQDVWRFYLYHGRGFHGMTMASGE